MKILVTHRPGGAFGFITDSWINCLVDKGHTVKRWNGTLESWNEFDPDLYVGSSGHKQPIPKNRRSLVALHVNPYCPMEINGINEPPESIEWVKNIGPDIVFGYGFDDDKIYWKHWTEKLGIKWCPMPTAGDKTIYKNLNIDRTFDIVYIGGRWNYKATSIDKYLLNACDNLKDKNIYIGGWGDWPNGMVRGIVSDEDVPVLFNQAKVCPCISEPHTQAHGFDLPERFFKVALCGSLPVHDPVPTLRRIIPNIIMAKSPAEYLELCRYYINNDSDRIKTASDISRHVLNNHTYHHRFSRLFSELGLSSESSNML